ncbi:MAG: REP-associated tyrosine transposase [Armatimonadota bacterium]
MTQHFKVHDGLYPHFITSTIIHWIPVFTRDDYFRVLSDSLNYSVEQKGLLVHGYVIMPNHFHAVCSQVDGKLSAVVRDIKRHTASLILEKLRSESRITWLRAFERAGGDTPKVWDDSFHPMQVHKREFFEQKLGYMHNNPLRAGFVVNPENWKYSSAGFYYKQTESLVPIAAIEW